jgi:uncharacterized protein YkwD
MLRFLALATSILVLAASLAAQGSSTRYSEYTSAPVRLDSVERTAFNLLNRKRIENGLASLAWSDGVAQIARLHSRNMAELKFFSHRGKDHKMVSDRADDANLGGWESIGENIAFNRGFGDPIARAIDNWLSSPSHRQNLLSSNWKESAIGVAVASDGSYYFTQVFLKR